MELLTTRKNVVAVGVSLLTKTRNSAALSMDVKVSRFSIDLTPSTTKIAYHSLVWLSRNMVTVVKLVSRKWILFPVLDLRPNHLKIFAIFEIFFTNFMQSTNYRILQYFPIGSSVYIFYHKNIN